jgi:endo-1,4-beta-xylanase
MVFIGSVLFLCAGLAAQPALKEVFKGSFVVGAAMSSTQIAGNDTLGVSLINVHFGSLTAENAHKWENIHPSPGVYDFVLADQFVAFAESRKLFVVGHTLVWHNQTPSWVFKDEAGKSVDRATLLNRLRDHIFTVVGRYKGRVHGWDVVNEALEEDGSLRETPWHQIIGDDYIVKAFEFAHEADPAAELYYNDFSLENEPKMKGALKIISDLRTAGIKVAAVGSQGHYKMDWPTPAQITTMVEAFAAVGVPVMITELDVDVLPDPVGYRGADINFRIDQRPEWNPYTKGLPDSVQRALARRYGALFEAFVQAGNRIRRVTFWGVHDGASWLNNWPVPGRSAYPLLFDRKGAPKPAFDAVLPSAGTLP